MRLHILRHQKGSLSLLLLATAVFTTLPIAAEAETRKRSRERTPCLQIADLAFQSCKAELAEEHFVSLANCTNHEERGERQECKSESRSDKRDAREECSEIRQGRKQLCKDLRETVYNPQYSSNDFLSPAETAASPNKYFPLVPGTVWVYHNTIDDETITVTVTNKTRAIDGVTTIVVNDVVILNATGATIENTDDYYAQHTNGDVWYFGEVAQEYENGFLDSLDGSFIAGEDGALPGILVKASPQIGELQRQEYALREAEDFIEVLSTTGSEATPGASCSGDCLVTKDGTPLDPEAIEHKYYAPGVGIMLEIDPESGSRTELISITRP